MKQEKQELELSNDKLLSDVISFLRFPLIVGVIMIHIGFNREGLESSKFYDSTIFFFRLLSAIAVPMFFMFSGFLLFNKCADYTFNDYLKKLKSRFRTLLIPYFIWNFIAILFYYRFGLKISSIEDFFRAFWDYRTEETMTYPILIQFWYVRDLLVNILLSPIVYWLIKKINYGWVLLLGLLWVFNLWILYPGLNLMGIFFFALGAYLGIYKKTLLGNLKNYTILWGLLYVAFIVPNLLVQSEEPTILRRITILIGIAFTLSLTSRMISCNKWKVNKFLAESSFFVFASHIFSISFITPLITRLIPINHEIILILCFFATTILSSITSLLGYYIMKCFLPKTTALITGGR